jgi:ABC-type antimicrobial peptide transport system ATPase subunit
MRYLYQIIQLILLNMLENSWNNTIIYYPKDLTLCDNWYDDINVLVSKISTSFFSLHEIKKIGINQS